MGWWKSSAGTGMAAVTFTCLKRVVKTNSLVGSYILGMLGGLSGKMAYTLLTAQQRSELEDILGRSEDAESGLTQPRRTNTDQDLRDKIRRSALGQRRLRATMEYHGNATIGPARNYLSPAPRRATPSSTLSHVLLREKIAQSIKMYQLEERVRDIERERENNRRYDLRQTHQSYQIAINDSTIVNPFLIDAVLLGIVHDQTTGARTEDEKAQRLFHWVEDNILYDYKMDRRGYRGSIETFNTGNGVCGEMAFLYVCMARGAKLISRWTHVTRDFQGDKVSHACAAVLIGERQILVDPAYHRYDIKHKEYAVLTDREAITMFRSMQGR